MSAAAGRRVGGRSSVGGGFLVNRILHPSPASETTHSRRRWGRAAARPAPRRRARPVRARPTLLTPPSGQLTAQRSRFARGAQLCRPDSLKPRRDMTRPAPSVDPSSCIHPPLLPFLSQFPDLFIKRFRSSFLYYTSMKKSESKGQPSRPGACQHRSANEKGLAPSLSECAGGAEEGGGRRRKGRVERRVCEEGRGRASAARLRQWVNKMLIRGTGDTRRLGGAGAPRGRALTTPRRCRR